MRYLLASAFGLIFLIFNPDVFKGFPGRRNPGDVWIDLVPFNETRRYLRSVLSYMVIYDKRLGREPKRLKERMAPIAAAASQLAGA